MTKTVAFIPARGGSKGIRFKNVKRMAGKPLIHWAMEAALACDLIDEVYVATDSEHIKAVAAQLDSPKLNIIGRDPVTVSDTASTESAIFDFCDQYEFDNFILIQATSPFLSTNDLTQGMKLFQQDDVDSVVSTCRQVRFMWQDDKPVNYDPFNRPRRQDFNGFEVENGAFYISSKKQMLASGCRISGNIRTYEMPADSYHELDEPDDWLVIESLLNAKHQTEKVIYQKKDIKILMMDVDGVLTDGSMYYTENGDEIKRFSTYDGKALEILRNHGIKTAIITAEDTKMVRDRAKKTKVDYLYQGVSNKLNIAEEICEKEGIALENVAYVGDDLNDRELLQMVGLAACPVNAVYEIKQLPNIIHLATKGGSGVIRELAGYILGNVLPEKIHSMKKLELTPRPWGSYETFMDEGQYKLKRITVNPQQKLSLQLHNYRSEHWIIVQGKGLVTVGEHSEYKSQGQTIFIPINERHRVENHGNVPLVFIEVQLGHYLEEDDIIRFEDMYGRVPEYSSRKALAEEV